MFFDQLAHELQGEGITMTAVLQKFIIDVPVTKYSVKEMWRSLQEAMFGKTSTTQLLKKQEIDQIYDSLNKFFGENMEIQIPPFPNWQDVLIKKGEY